MRLFTFCGDDQDRQPSVTRGSYSFVIGAVAMASRWGGLAHAIHENEVGPEGQADDAPGIGSVVVEEGLTE